MVEEQVAGHEHEPARLGEGDELLHLLAAHRRRLLDEDVLARLERLLRELVVGRHRGRDDDGVDLLVRQQVGERGRRARLRVARAELGQPLRVGVADPRELGELADDPDDVLPPAADARMGDAGQSFQTFSLVIARAARGVAEVDDELRVVDQLRVVDARVRRRDHDDVVRRRLERHGGERDPVGRRTRGRGRRGSRRARPRCRAGGSASRPATRASPRCRTCRPRRARAPALLRATCGRRG